MRGVAISYSTHDHPPTNSFFLRASAKYEPSFRTGNNKGRNMAENGESSCALDFIAANFIALLEFLT